MALALLIRMKRSLNWEEFEKESETISLNFTTLKLDETEALSEEEFFTSVINNEQIELEQKKMLAALLYEKLEYYTVAFKEDNYRNTLLKCLCAYSFLNANQTENEFNLEVHYRLEQLKKFAAQI